LEDTENYFMNDEYIRDRTGHIIGRETSDGWMRDGTGRLVAKYDKGDQRTRTREGKIVGSGDQREIELGRQSEA
jgi:hypothetical protein